MGDTLFERIKLAVSEKSSESGERNAVATVLASYGHSDVIPQAFETKAADGRKIRVYLWRKTPAGDIVLVTGPDVAAEVVHAADIDLAKAQAGVYLKAADGLATKKAQDAMLKQAGRASALGAKRYAEYQTRAEPRPTKTRKPRALKVVPDLDLEPQRLAEQRLAEQAETAMASDDDATMDRLERMREKMRARKKKPIAAKNPRWR